MAFINELVPEEVKPKFDIEVFYNPYLTLYKQMEFYRWVVDHDRDLFLIKLGSGGGPGQDEGLGLPEKFAFSYQGEVIKFEATYRGEGDSRKGDLVAFVEVTNIKIPEHFELQRNALEQLLIEALEAYGNSAGHTANISALFVTFK